MEGRFSYVGEWLEGVDEAFRNESTGQHFEDEGGDEAFGNESTGQYFEDEGADESFNEDDRYFDGGDPYFESFEKDNESAEGAGQAFENDEEYLEVDEYFEGDGRYFKPFEKDKESYDNMLEAWVTWSAVEAQTQDRVKQVNQITEEFAGLRSLIESDREASMETLGDWRRQLTDMQVQIRQILQSVGPLRAELRDAEEELRDAVKAHWEQTTLATTPPSYDTINLEELALFLDGEFLPAGIKHKDVILGLTIRVGSLRSSEKMMARAVKSLKNLKQLRHRRGLRIRICLGCVNSIIDIERFLIHFHPIYRALTKTRSATFGLIASTEEGCLITQESDYPKIVQNFYEMDKMSWREMYGFDELIQRERGLGSS